MSPTARLGGQVIGDGYHPLSQVANLERERPDLSRPTVAWSRIDESRSLSESCRAA